MARAKRGSEAKPKSVDLYPELRALIGLHGEDPAVFRLLHAHRARLPSLATGAGFASVDLRSSGVRLLFWVGWGGAKLPATYDVVNGALVEVKFFQEGIERHKAYAGSLPHGLRVEMTRDELRAALGAPTDACACGQEPPCFLSWHVRHFDGPLAAHVTHHAKHAGRTRPREGRVDIAVHLPRARN